MGPRETSIQKELERLRSVPNLTVHIPELERRAEIARLKDALDEALLEWGAAGIRGDRYHVYERLRRVL